MSSPSFGLPHLHHRLIGSTNDRAKALAEDGAPSGTVVTAAEQSAGRGRRGRVWSAPAGSALLYSAILRPLRAEHRLLPLAVPLAVCEACEAVAPVECRVKWPNDIWVGERKLAGVLIEARPPEWAVIGIGINVDIAPEQFPADLRWPATSLGPGADPGAVRSRLNEALGRWVEAAPDRIQSEYGARDALAGREITWEPAANADTDPGTGVAEGIDPDGNLVVRLADGGTRALGSGEVQLRLG